MNDPRTRGGLASLVEIDRIIHEPARLAIMSLLFVVESADFIFLLNQTSLSWGNLSAHLAKLEEAGYLHVEKTFRGRRPNTTLSLTEKGRNSFSQYLAQIREFVDGFKE